MLRVHRRLKIMKKDFDKWNKEKKELHEKDVELYYHVREIWWCYLGLNVGTEQDGNDKKFLRPVVIVRAFGPATCLIVPLTTSTKKHPLRIFVGKIKNKDASAVLSQMKVVDTKRLLEKIDSVEKDVFKELRKTIKKLF